MEHRTTDLPFKTGESSIVIIKELPVFQCSECHEYTLAEAVMSEVERILASVDKSAELEIVRFAGKSGNKKLVEFSDRQSP